jgi:rhamnulokinase
VWEKYSYEKLAAMAEQAPSMLARLDPDCFLEAGNMPSRIAEHCRETGQTVPEGPGQVTRVILESLAFRYKDVLETLERLSGRSIRVIHVVGGGSRNALLNRLTAEITGREVIAGPAEATAAGNILVQAIGAGVVKDLAEARRIVKASGL